MVKFLVVIQSHLYLVQSLGPERGKKGFGLQRARPTSRCGHLLRVFAPAVGGQLSCGVIAEAENKRRARQAYPEHYHPAIVLLRVSSGDHF